jgi:uncharacterized membrane protein
MIRDKNPNHWKLLVFYYNPDQPSLFVAKRLGGPMTLNFARPMAWAIAAIPLAIIAISAIIYSFRLVR